MGSWPSLNLVMEFNCDNDEKCTEIVTKLFEDFDDQPVPENEIYDRYWYIETPFNVNDNFCFVLTMLNHANRGDKYQVTCNPNHFGIFTSFGSSCDLHDIEMMKDEMMIFGDKISEKYGIPYTFVVTGTYG